jgi:hypothetical protein
MSIESIIYMIGLGILIAVFHAMAALAGMI